MESELAKYAQQQLIEDAKRMTLEERLAAYIEHCASAYALYAAGVELRAAERGVKDEAG